MRNNFSVINVYESKTVKSKVVTQLLYGDTFKIIEKSGLWIKIKNKQDNYKGFIKNKKFPPNHLNTHKVFKLYSNLYAKPNNKNIIKKKLSFGSKIKVLEKKGSFYKFDNLWVKKKDLKKINFCTKDPFHYIKKFVNVKYTWGGKHYNGVDCSGLIQLFMNFNNKFCPRDSSDQKKYFKYKIKLKNIKRNDLLFWPGHVALVISKTKLIHAYAPLSKVATMPIKYSINKILKTANLKVSGSRRIC